MRKRSILFFLLFPVLSSFLPANKTTVALAGPEAVAAGTEVTITVHVSHKGNSAIHHTNWVWVKADGKEIARWEFTASHRPESADFSREVKYMVSGPVELTAQGNCVLHGGQEPAVLKIGVK